MKKLYRNSSVRISLIILAQFLYLNSAYAQSQIISNITNATGNKTSGYGRDFWFAIPQNFSSGAQKYFNIYVSSLRNTTVYFQVGGGPVIKKTVTVGKVVVFESPTPTKPSSDLSVTTEIATSGVVETKSVHVWSNDADLSVNFLSRVPFSSGGMYVLPTVGWGTEYVVGAYESIFDPSGASDWPSEFAIVSNQDSTTVSITPTWDIRKDQFPSVIEHPKGQPFDVLLNKGECVQYQTVLPINDKECDLTGTIIKSNNPIGVMGASVDPYIPFPYGYGDYCLSMLQPLRTWSNTYLTAPFAGRKYGGDVYCVIGTKAQNILRNGVHVAHLNSYADHLFIYDDVSPSPAAIWTSDAPFELMQYIPSATFGTGNPNSTTRNQGDADMCNINPASQFRNNVFFQIPVIDVSSGQAEFTNYVNILLPVNHESKTTYDGILLTALSSSPDIVKQERFSIPNTSWEAMRLTYKTNFGEGSHSISSDTGVGVYVYGYGTDDSYSWSGHLGTGAGMNSADTIPPIAGIAGDCFSVHIKVTDDQVNASKLSAIQTDSLYNFSITVDPNFITGGGMGSSFYDLKIIDSSKEAFAIVSTYDIAGNFITITSTYKPQMISITPSFQNYGAVQVGMTQCQYDTITNIGQVPYSFNSLELALSNSGFIIDTAISTTAIPVGGSRIIKICFTPTSPKTAADTLELSDGCTIIKTLMIANAGIPNFTLTDNDFTPCLDPGISRVDTSTIVTNPSAFTITIDSIWVDDPVHFTYKGSPSLPIVIPTQTNLAFVFGFTPTAIGKVCTKVHFMSKEAGVQTANICGCAQTSASVVENGYSSSLSKTSSEYSQISAKMYLGSGLALLPPIPNPASGKTSICFIYGLKYDSSVDLSIYDMLGNFIATVIHEGFQSLGIYEVDFLPGANMPSGSYIYRLSGAGRVTSGKLVIAN